METARRDTRRMVLLSMFVAIIAAMTFVPYTGFIAYGGVSITTLHVPVIIAIIKLGTRDGFIVATAFGVLAFVRALTSAPTWGVIPFMNPMVSVLPRMLMGILTAMLAVWLAKFFTNRTAYYAVVAFIGTSLNTVFVLIALSIFWSSTLGETIVTIFSVIISINWALEASLAVLVVPGVCKALDRLSIHS